MNKKLIEKLKKEGFRLDSTPNPSREDMLNAIAVARMEKHFDENPEIKSFNMEELDEILVDIWIKVKNS